MTDACAILNETIMELSQRGCVFTNYGWQYRTEKKSRYYLSNKCDIHVLSNSHLSQWSKMQDRLKRERESGVFISLLDKYTIFNEVLNKVVEDENNDTAGYVYLIYSPTFNLVKIGKTVNFKSRYKTYITESPEALHKEGLIKCDMKLESHLHFYLHKYRKHGEWFSVSSKFLKKLHDGIMTFHKPAVVIQHGDGIIGSMLKSIKSNSKTLRKKYLQGGIND